MRRRRTKKLSLKSRLLGRGKGDVRRLELLGGTTVIATSLLVIVIFLTASVQPYALTVQQSAAVISSAIVQLVNGDRAENALPALAVDPKLTAVAQRKADDMAVHSYFAHTSPDGKDPWYWFAQEGYAFSYAGENLAVDFTDSIDVERAWMNSPGHRKNILDPHYTQIGIATAAGEFEGHKTVYVVQVFGTPAPALIEQPVVETNIPEDPKELATARLQEDSTRVLGAGAESEEASLEAPATVQGAQAQGPIAQMMSSPKNTMRYSYYLIGIFLFLALAYTTRFELKKHHIRHATAAGGLILLMGILFMAAEYFIFVPLTIPDSGASVARGQ